MKCLKQIYSKGLVLDAGGKTGVPGENLRKQVWTGNQMHIRRRDWESNPGPLVHSAGKNRYATCFPKDFGFFFCLFVCLFLFFVFLFFGKQNMFLATKSKRQKELVLVFPIICVVQISNIVMSSSNVGQFREKVIFLSLSG